MHFPCQVFLVSGIYTTEVLMTDQQLLQRYAADGSDDAFEQLVSRHLNLVYSTALRLGNGDAQFAQDVAQLVFTNLARKAATLPPGVVLAGWLHRDTCFTALEILRKERRRRARERTAVTMNAIEHDVAPTDWHQIRPLLDDLLNRLEPTDRDALLLRFFEERSLNEIGVQLGVGESGASHRVARALDRLRELLAIRGISTTAGALSVTLASHAVQVAPAGMAAALATGSLAAIAAGTTTSTSTLGMIKLMGMTKLKLALTAAVVGGLIPPMVVQYRTAQRLRNEITLLRVQTNKPPVPTPAPPTPDTARGANDLARLRSEHLELLRLRGQVSMLRGMVNELTGTLTNAANKAALERRLGRNELQVVTEAGSPFKPLHYYPAEVWADVGLDTPEATLQTALWAMKSQHADRLVQALNLSAEEKASLLSRLTADTLQTFPGAGALGIKVESVGGTQQSPPLEYVCEFDRGEDKPPVRAHFRVERVEGSWRLAGNVPVEGPDDAYQLGH